ncbi:MAG TPA: outer membrane beta-barrel protein [Gammaproteobacteria bacterium]|nr:outer membrane beta-barrel protein [Gammaproteobacteria bacterium]
MLNTKSLISGMAVFFCVTSAMANMPVPYGWYLEGNVGSTRLIQNAYPTNSSYSSSGLGGNINAGYKFMPYFGIELGYTRYANTVIYDTSSTKAGSDKHYSYDLAGKGIIPIGLGGFELFGKFGVQRIYSSISISNTSAANNISLSASQHSHTGYYLGAGGEYYFLPAFAAVAQWARANGNSTSGTLDLYSLGLSYIFG